MTIDVGGAIGSNAKEIARQIREDAKRVSPAIRKGTIDGLAILYAGSRGLLSQLIYDVPIPRVRRRKRDPETHKLGRNRFVALWKRTGQLLRGEKSFAPRLEGDDWVGTIDNATPYAAYRHEQHLRPAPWRALTVQRFGGSARDAFLAALDALKS